MRKAIIFLILALFLLASCGQTSERGADINYKQGFVDLTINSAGNKEEFQEQRLELPVSLQNTVAYDIEDVVVSVKGFDNFYVELYDEHKELPKLEGKSIFNPEGMKEDVLFEGMIKKLLPGAEKQQQDYRVNVKYNSKVEFSPSICVTSQLNGQGSSYDTYQGACTFEKEISYDGQGAPLGITSLEIIPHQGRQVELRMKIENRGKGTVGKVSVLTSAIGGKPLTCEFRSDTVENKVEFESGQKSVTLICAGYVGSDGTYTTPVFVELLYDYELDQKETMMILK